MARIVKKGRLLGLFIVPQLIFVGIAASTEASTLITVLSITVFASAVGVCLAYSPSVYDVLVADRDLDRADYMAIGVFMSWFSIVVLRVWSIWWRYLGKPDWLTNSDVVSYSLYMAIWAAIFHLAAPGAVSDRVPPRRWINIGIGVTIALLTAILGAYYFEALAIDG